MRYIHSVSSVWIQQSYIANFHSKLYVVYPVPEAGKRTINRLCTTWKQRNRYRLRCRSRKLSRSVGIGVGSLREWAIEAQLGQTVGILGVVRNARQLAPVYVQNLLQTSRHALACACNTGLVVSHCSLLHTETPYADASHTNRRLIPLNIVTRESTP